MEEKGPSESDQARSDNLGKVITGKADAIRLCLAAFAGAYLARRVLRKVTFRAVQVLVGVLLILTGLGLGAGLI